MGIIIANAEGNIIHSNAVYQKMVGYARDELNRKFIELTHPDDAAKHLILFNEMVAGKRDHYWIEERLISKNRTMIWVNLSATAVRDAKGNFKYLFSLIEDMSERKKLEDQLRHAQKMEAVGQLAGGMAHDINNLLTAIIGYASLIKMKLKNNGQLLQTVNQILDISARGASLTRGLLTFSRKQIVTLTPVRTNELVQRVGNLLPRLIGEQIEIKIRPAKEELMILADSGQIEQVIVNIATNARDAMPRGGTFIIETAREVLDEEAVVLQEHRAPGDYALISFTDTGKGIDASARAKLFEPFFTTKEVGKGTGLGLAIVYGIIKQHKGYIHVYSEVGQGTTFRIYLPLINIKPAEEERGKKLPVRGGTETILLAEDENEVREALAGILKEFGFTIIEARNGDDAIKKFKDNKDRIQLIIMDVVMPKKSGREAYEEIQQIRPDVQAIFISGYTKNIIQDKGILNEEVNFISKPFHPKDILEKIREVLDR
jgi:PAS domain S-box-containing protein